MIDIRARQAQITRIMQKVVAKSLDNEDTRGMDVRQILRNYKMLEEIFEDVLDEYFSWVETYKAIQTKNGSKTVEIHDYMMTVMDSLNFESEKIKIDWVTKILQSGKWKKPFRYEWISLKKLWQNKYSYGKSIIQTIAIQLKQGQRKTPQEQTSFFEYVPTTQKLLYTYLQNRKYFAFKELQLQAITFYISQKLKSFMKSFIKKILLLSQVSNRKLSSKDTGDQFKYFRNFKNPNKETILSPHPQNFTTIKLRYPSQLMMFNKMQHFEKKHENLLRQQWKIKQNGAKRTQKLLPKYMLQNQKDDVPQKVDRFEQGKGKRLLIKSHIVEYLLQKHPFFKNSQIQEMGYYLS